MKKLTFVIKQFAKMFLQQVFLPLIYRRYRGQQTDDRLVVFADAHNDTMPASMEPLCQAMEEDGYHVVKCISDYGSQSFSESTKQMIAFMKLYAKAKYVVICDYFLPVSSCSKREETKVIQLWHAGGAFKKFGYDAPDDIPPYYKGSVTKNYDLVSVSAPRCIPFYASAFRLPEEKVEPLGVCRTDIFFDRAYLAACRKAFDAQYPEDAGKKLLLWAPTFRGNAGDPVTLGFDAVAALQAQLGDGWKVLIKLHPHAEQKTPRSNCTIPTQQLLPITDLLVTDFSSILFDYSLFGRPAVLFAPDYDSYAADRGFYLDCKKDLPYPVVTENDGLYDAVQHAIHASSKEQIEIFRHAYMENCDGHATARILNRMKAL